MTGLCSEKTDNDYLIIDGSITEQWGIDTVRGQYVVSIELTPRSDKKYWILKTII